MGVWWRAGGGVAVLQTGPMAVVLVYIQQCKSFVEMCIVSCLSASPALVVDCLAVVTLPTRSTAPTVAGCRLVGCSVVSGRPLRSRAVAGVSWHVCVCLGPVLASHSTSLTAAAAAAAWRGRGRVHIAGWSYGGVGPERVSGGEEEGGGVRSGPGEARTILLLHIISVRPSKQPLMLHHHQHGGLGIGLGSRTLERAGR